MDSLLPGTQVTARGLLWELVETAPAGAEQRYRLRCSEGALRGEELDLLVPFERVEPVQSAIDPRRAAPLRAWRLYHEAFLLEQALGASALLAVQPGRLRMEDYQLVPVLRALRMGRPRLLLADDVGLGKTVQAGLVFAELIARRRAHRILVVSPAGPLLTQWHDEMRTRFGLRFTVLDRDSLQEIRHASELGTNPFDHVALGLISIDFAKQERVLQDLERTTYDVIVIDEAHHCTRLGATGDTEDSQRRRLAEVLARQADGLLLLTATPHDGFDQHFASLVELLDPSLVDGHEGLRGTAWRRHVVRRLKQHVRNADGTERFLRRVVHPRPVAFSRAAHPRFAALQEALLALVAPLLTRALRAKRYGEVLALVSLLKRSVSTVAACTATLTQVAATFGTALTAGRRDQDARRQRLRTLAAYRKRLERYGALSFEEEQDQAFLEAEDIADELLEGGAQGLLDFLEARRKEGEREQERERRRLKPLTEVVDALDELVALGGDARDDDPKLAALLAEIRTIRAAEPSANVLVYSEYTDSQAAAAGALRAAIESGDLTGDVLTLSGDDPDKARAEILARFASEDDRVLLSTDAAAEGLNLQARCHHLVHLELPYNPNRLEQRNGRIDRYGQTRTPHVRYLYLSGTFEERLLLRLVAKYERQRSRLTFVPNTLGVLASETATSTVRLLEGLAAEPGRLFESAPGSVAFAADGTESDDEADAGASPEYRDLLAEISRAVAGFEKAAKTHSWLAAAGLNAEARLAAEAAAARADGERLAAVELVPFVTEAVLADGGSVTRTAPDVLELALPPSWTHGLTDLPAFDGERRVLRLTTTLSRSRDDAARPVDYLGRAHPLVRRALERVRTMRFGADGDSLDRRASAVRGDGPAPELLCTFLATVDGALGREYERVLAVRVPRDGAPVVLASPTDWVGLAALERAVPTRGVWERWFGDWAEAGRTAALEAARAAFAPLAEEAVRELERELAEEEALVAEWLATRARDLCGDRPVQADLFAPSAAAVTRAPDAPGDPTARLAAFATDRANPSARRREAEGVLRLAETRRSELARRRALRVLSPTPLGLLLVIPATGTEA